MKTLVIHPDDRSTDFLKLIYEDKKDWTIINDCFISRMELMKAINAHDRIIMMGHGTPSGLINPKTYGLIINETFVPLLKKKETISIWCHSDQFFRKYNIPGFHTGMIISEVSEANFVLRKTPLTREETLNNMETFARIINKCIDETPEKMKEFILNNYIFEDEVTQFNRQNIIVLKDAKVKLFKYVYNNNKYFKLALDAEEYPLFIRFYDKKRNLHKVNKENMNKVLNQGDKGFALYSKEDWNMEVFKSALQDHITFRINELNTQLDQFKNILNSIN